jgi:UDP-N-acetylmuramoyl-tripeptide--D-alanyl-D-alanine ligase
MRFRALDAAAALGARLLGGDVDVAGVSFDTRSLRPGQLFVPIVAERDGHDFIPAARAGGASLVLTARSDAPGVADGPAILVDDTLTALMALGRWARDRWGHRDGGTTVIGITGSVGKTSTKDLAAVALGASARVWSNERSFNNDFGLPSTILNAPDDTEVMVLEMGMRGFGEIARLAAIGRPRLGVVTRVAEAHGGLVGGIDGVARAKAELIEALPADGVAILNGDDVRVRAMASRTVAAHLSYGEGPGVDVRADDVALDHLARARFRVSSPWGSAAVALGVSGRHMVPNALAALACAGALGHDLETAAAALSAASLSANRMDVRRLAGGGLLVDDCYNANPTSMRAALDALVALPAGRHVAVLGVMAEISEPEREHRAIAEYATERGVELIAIGTPLYGVAPCDGVDDAVARVGSLAGGGAALVKASRAAGLERVVAALVAAAGGLGA